MLDHLKQAIDGWLGPQSTDGGETSLHDISLYYDWQDLAAATSGFSERNKLGEGAAGSVFRGTLRGGTEVAIKVIRDMGGLGGFEDEVKVLSRFRHPNLVTLLGWGHRDREKYLIYELLTGGDVSKKLEKCKRDGAPFSWSERLRVAYDAARGLSYMLNQTTKAFHRDIKPANILLDVGGAAKMADFGLASVVHDTRAHLTVDNIAGTPGYACPTYIQTGHVSEASEVYSFGIVLLELLINQPPALAGPQGDIIYPLLQIVQPATPGAHGRVLSALDPRAGWPRQVVDPFIDLSLSSVHMNPHRRPDFEHIVRVLRSLSNQVGGPAAGPSRGMPPPMPGGGGAPWMSMAPGQPGPGMSMGPSPPLPGGPGYGGMGYGGGAPPSVPPPSTAPTSQQLAEVVLECTLAEGVDLGAIPVDRRAIAFTVDPSKGRLSFTVGRQHQPDFFDTVVRKKERLSSISRSHFELAWEPPAACPILRKLSGNPLLIDDHPVGSSEAPKVPDGARIGFTGTTDDAPRFLVLRVTLRSRGAVATEGAHPAIMLALQKKSTMPGYGSMAPTVRQTTSVVAVLECVYSVGGDPSNLRPDSRAIAIALNEPVDIGRQHQPANFYETLLQADTRWLTFISRSHCRGVLQRVGDGYETDPSSWALRIENLSSNVILVGGRPLAKGKSESIKEGGTLDFVAVMPGEGESKFLRFVLRRAKGMA